MQVCTHLSAFKPLQIKQHIATGLSQPPAYGGLDMADSLSLNQSIQLTDKE